MPLEMYLPFDEDSYIAGSVDAADGGWIDRFRQAASRSAVHLMPQEREPLPPGANPYEQGNLWMLEAASRFGPARIEFICLWNGGEGDGPGGAAHLWKEVERHGGRAHWLDTRKLW